nr:immunoglobulin heavy chain junction region [Mus musculus]
CVRCLRNYYGSSFAYW